MAMDCIRLYQIALLGAMDLMKIILTERSEWVELNQVVCYAINQMEFNDTEQPFVEFKGNYMILFHFNQIKMLK